MNIDDAKIAGKAFDEVWAEMEAVGFQYGPKALEQVKLGWMLAVQQVMVPAGGSIAEDVPTFAAVGEAFPLPPRLKLPPACACFPGTCRGGQIVDGKLANGQRCKACIPAK